MKLNPEQLAVTSFETSAPVAKSAVNALATTTCPQFPTPATICFICPPITYRCA